MAIRYKADILSELKKAGYSSYRIRKEKILSESTLSKLRAGQTSITLENVQTFCRLLKCQPGDLLEYVESEDD